MEMRQLGKTGLHVSVIGFGSAPVGFLETDVQSVAAILNTLLDAGVNVIDTAAGYPGSEEMIGETVSRRRQEYVLVSKCGAPGSGSDDPSWTPAALRQSIDRSLLRLKTDAVDVMLLHSCSLDTLRRGDALGALVEARKAGRVRFIGYSGDNEAAAWAAEQGDVAVIETSVNVCDQANIDHVLPKTQQHDVGVIAKRPLANACWKDLQQQRGLYRQYAETYTQRMAQMQIDPAELGVADQPADAWPRIALRFALSQPGVHTAIVGTTDPGHALANLAAAAEGRLPEGVVRRLRDAFRRAEAAAGGEAWTGQT